MNSCDHLSFRSIPIRVGTDHKHIVPFSKVFPLLVSSQDLSPSFETPENLHDYLEVTFINQGNGVFRVGHNEYPISNGDVLIMGPSLLHSIEVTDPTLLSLTSVYFMPNLVFSPGEPDSNFDWLRPFYDQETMKNPIIDNHLTDKIAALFHQLLDSQNEELYYRHLKIRINLLEILLGILQALDFNNKNLNNPTQKTIGNSERLDRVLSMMNKRYQDNISLTDAAEEACMSTQHFCRFFKNATGNTFTEHLSRIRVAQAKQLLLQSDFRITDIAYEVGFGSQSYFFRTFKQITGYSPREFLTKTSTEK